MVVVQRLAKWSILTPEDPGSNLAITNLMNIYLPLTVCGKGEHDEERGREWRIRATATTLGATAACRMCPT